MTRHGRTVGLYVPLPQESDLNEHERLLEAGRLMQAELQRLGLTEEELAAEFKAWRRGQLLRVSWTTAMVQRYLDC